MESVSGLLLVALDQTADVVVNAVGAIMGSHHHPSHRPFLQSLCYLFAGLLEVFNDFSSLHYLLTRSLTTGISLLPKLVLMTTSMFFELTEHPDDVYDFTEIPMWIGQAFNLTGLLFLANLAFHLEWQWGTRSWCSWIPVGVKRRRSTHSERASARLDWKFGWKERATVKSILPVFDTRSC